MCVYLYILPVWLRACYSTLAMMTSSDGNIFRVTGHLCGEFTGHRWIPAQRPVTRSFDAFFDLRLNKCLSKQSWGWWFETPTRPSWRHCKGDNSGVSWHTSHCNWLFFISNFHSNHNHFRINITKVSTASIQVIIIIIRLRFFGNQFLAILNIFLINHAELHF